MLYQTVSLISLTRFLQKETPILKKRVMPSCFFAVIILLFLNLLAQTPNQWYIIAMTEELFVL